MTDAVHVYGAHQSGSEAGQLLATFWPRVMAEVRTSDINQFKTQELPLARIKKIMKQDEEVKMISAEAPVLFSKAAEIFISELSLRAWIHTEDNKRRTLQRNDIALAITKYDQFDFLIDIVPRDELKPQKRQGAMVPEQVQYYLQLAQMQQSQQPQIIQIQAPEHQQQHQQQVQAAPPTQVSQQQAQNTQQVQLHPQHSASDLQQYAVQLASGGQMQYRLVPQIIQHPGSQQAVVQLQAQPHQLQQNTSGQTVIAVHPTMSQQEGQQSSSEVNYNQIYQLATQTGGQGGPIFITTQQDQPQGGDQEGHQNE